MSIALTSGRLVPAPLRRRGQAVLDSLRRTQLLAPLLPLAALAIEKAAWAWLQPDAWILFYPAVFLAASLTGCVGGLVATVVTLPLVWFGFLASPGGALPALLPALAFVLTGLGVSLVSRRSLRVARGLASAQARIESDQRVAAVVETAMDAIVTINSAQRIVHFNAAAERMFGYQAADVIGQPLETLLPQRHRGGHALHVGRYLQSGVTARSMGHLLELNGLRADGGEFAIEGAISLAGVGEHVLATVVLRDVSARRATERRLAESEQRYRLLIEHQTELVSLSKPDGELLFVNAAYAAHHGRTVEELVGTSLFDLIPEDEREPVRERRREVLVPGRTIYGEDHVLGSGKQVRWVGWTNRGVVDAGGQVVAIHSVGRDITEQRALEDQLRTSMGEVVDLYDSAPCGYHSIGPEGTYLRINATELGWLGCSRLDVIGFQGPRDFCSAADRERFDEAFGAIRHGARSGRIELTLLGRGQPPRRVAIDMSAVSDEDGNFVMTRSVMFDVSAQKQAEDRLESNRRLLATIGSVAGIGGWKLQVDNGEFVWSEQCCAIVGLPPGTQPTLSQMIAFYSPEYRTELRERIGEATRSGAGFDKEFRFTRLDGRPLWVRTVVSVEFEDDRPARVIGAFQDVTATHQQLERIEQLYEMAEQQRGELADFRESAESETEFASFLLSRLTRTEQLDDPGVRHLWLPAEAFSGDVIAAARSSAGDLYGLVADATGHGLAAAINLIPLTAAFYAMASKGFNLETIAEQMNKVVKDYSLSDRFVAVTLARFIHRDNQLEVVNAGNPRALLIDGDGTILREFRSGSVPLGILARPQYRPVVENVELGGGERLVMFSDGLVEAADVAGAAFGRQRLETALAVAGNRDPVPAIQEALERFLGSAVPADDVSLLVLRAVWADGGSAGAALAEGASHRLVQNDELFGVGDEAPEAPDGSLPVHPSSSWKIASVLSWRELKKLELVPVIVGFTRSLGLAGTVEAQLFTVLTELFVNALDHGLLGLDSRLKNQPDGFEKYFETRAERLAALNAGSITVTVERHEAGARPAWLEITVADSGPGFDHRAVLDALGHQAGKAGAVPSGRGLRLLLALCEQLHFSESGSTVAASLNCS